jgi:hypothetical protein
MIFYKKEQGYASRYEKEPAPAFPKKGRKKEGKALPAAKKQVNPF